MKYKPITIKPVRWNCRKQVKRFCDYLLYGDVRKCLDPNSPDYGKAIDISKVGGLKINNLK